MTTQNMEKENWIEPLIVEVMDEYISEVEETAPLSYEEKVPRRRQCFEKLVSFILSIEKEAERRGEKAMLEKVKKAIQPCLDYCREQNGRNSCKNCGLSEDTITRLLE